MMPGRDAEPHYLVFFVPRFRNYFEWPSTLFGRQLNCGEKTIDHVQS